MVLIQKNVFNFQSDSHNVSFFYKQLFGIQCCFRLNPKFILPSFDTCKVYMQGSSSGGGSTDSILK